MKRKGKRFLVLLTTASLSLNMLGISAYIQQVCKGIIILLILWADNYAQKRKAEAV